MRGSQKRQGMRYGNGTTVRVTPTQANWPLHGTPPEGATPRPAGFASMRMACLREAEGRATEADIALIVSYTRPTH